MQELYIPHHSVIHQLDARVKLIFTLLFIVFLNLTPVDAWPSYILFLTIILSLTLISRLGIGYVQKRALLAIPFVISAIPWIFTGPGPLVQAELLGGISVSFSPEGLQRFASIAIKSWISVQSAILLASTSRFPDLMIALQELKVPNPFVAIISLMWRYLFLIVAEAKRMIRARSSRSAFIDGHHRVGGSLFWRAGVTGGMVGSLLLRSFDRSERVYAAMLSRGYTSELPGSQTSTLSIRDLSFLLLGILLLVFVWLLGMVMVG